MSRSRKKPNIYMEKAIVKALERLFSRDELDYLDLVLSSKMYLDCDNLKIQTSEAGHTGYVFILDCEDISGRKYEVKIIDYISKNIIDVLSVRPSKVARRSFFDFHLPKIHQIFCTIAAIIAIITAASVLHTCSQSKVDVDPAEYQKFNDSTPIDGTTAHGVTSLSGIAVDGYISSDAIPSAAGLSGAVTVHGATSLSGISEDRYITGDGIRSAAGLSGAVTVHGATSLSGIVGMINQKNMLIMKLKIVLQTLSSLQKKKYIICKYRGIL